MMKVEELEVINKRELMECYGYKGRDPNYEVSIIIVTYNSKKYIKACVESILKQNYPSEIIVVDNCSVDGTVEFVEQNFPFVKIITSEKNLGYGAGNNLGVEYANARYIVVLNPDTIMEDKGLEELIKALKSEEKQIITPKILLYDRSSINTYGTIQHFTGLGFVRGLGTNPDNFHHPEYASGFSGCCFAIRKKDFIELGGFDQNFFMYREDGDLSWRGNLKNFKILCIPTAIIRHDYTLKVSPEKIYHLEKGRYMILRKYLSWKDFMLLSPSLIIVEFLTFGYAIKCGLRGVMYKCKAIKDGLNANVDNVKGDRDNLLKSLSVTIPIEQLTSNKAERIFKRFANKIFEWNFKVIR
jgi:GT2 family glycosyltransferase